MVKLNGGRVIEGHRSNMKPLSFTKTGVAMGLAAFEQTPKDAPDPSAHPECNGSVTHFS